MKKIKRVQVFFYIAFSLWAFSLGSQIEPDKQIPNLTLQWGASHPTGEHQISLVFKADRIDLFTTTTLWQDALSPRLGHFTSDLNEDWQMERNRIDIYQSLLKERPPVQTGKFLLREGFPADLVTLVQDSLHAPVVRLNEYEMREGDSYFPMLEGVFPMVWEKRNQWACVDCVIYRNHRKGIERRRISKDGTTVKTVFSYEQLNCYSIDKKLLECTDTHGGPTGNGWGSFQIKF